MNGSVESLDQVKQLKNKLESAVNSRSELEADFKTQTTMLIQFITKLSQVCKGIDLELDNKLANFRVLLNKSAPISEIEKQIQVISKLLQQHTKVNELNIKQMHQQFSDAGLTLQKTKGLPDKLRRDLRNFIDESSQSQDALIQYVPLLSRLLEFYDIALKAKSAGPTQGLLAQVNTKTIELTDESEEYRPLVKELIQQVNRLELSSTYDKELGAIRVKLDEEAPVNDLLDNFVGIFNLIISEFRQERETAKTFLSTLSETLGTVQTVVNNTIASNKDSRDKHARLNNQLAKQINEMAHVVEEANSLAGVKNDINDKLQKIAHTIKLKNSFEQQQQVEMEQQLCEMKNRVDELEEQGKTFKKRIDDQRAKSMQDPLTKLNNRGAFDDYFAKQMVRYHHNNFDLSVVVLDLDDFKSINDTYGHTAGDKTLQVIANTLSKEISEEHFVGRYGGEEFVLIFNNMDKEALLAKLNLLLKKVARLPFKFKNNKVSITASIGATHIQTTDNVHIAFERADTALYLSKSQGKNQVNYAE